MHSRFLNLGAPAPPRVSRTLGDVGLGLLAEGDSVICPMGGGLGLRSSFELPADVGMAVPAVRYFFAPTSTNSKWRRAVQ